MPLSRVSNKRAEIAEKEEKKNPQKGPGAFVGRLFAGVEKQKQKKGIKKEKRVSARVNRVPSALKFKRVKIAIAPARCFQTIF